MAAVLLAAAGALALPGRAADPVQSPMWRRGAELVAVPGNCNGCHAPPGKGVAGRGDRRLADGWDAPPLDRRSPAPVPWTEEALFAYLRTGRAPLHGAALGPMRAVVRGLAVLPVDDIRAMARYLASFDAPQSPRQAGALAEAAERKALLYNRNDFEDGAHVYASLCSPCHDAGPAALLHVPSSLALVTSVHGARPDNLLRVLLDGVAPPVPGGAGSMPAFGQRLDAHQLEQVAGYLRQRYAGEQPMWEDLPGAVARLRATRAVRAAAPDVAPR